MIRFLLFISWIVYSYTQISQSIILNQNMTLNYKLTDQTFIQFELYCITNGWCAIGFGQSMANADIICLSNQSSSVMVQDMISKPAYVNVKPLIDEQQDVSLETGYRNPGELYGQFVRKLIPDDPSDYPIQLMVETPIIWAINFNSQDMCASMHDQYGNQTITFGLTDLTSWACHYMCQFNCLGPLSSDCLICAIDELDSINGYCQKSDTTELLASEDIITGDFIVRWGYPIQGYIDLMIEIQRCDWFGLGFGQDMQNTDMIMFTVKGVINPDTSKTKYIVQVQDMYAIGNVIPDLDTMRGGTDDWNLLGYSYNPQNNMIKVKARRLLDTQDPNDIVFTKTDLTVAYAYANYTNGLQKYHGANRGILTLQLSLGDTRSILGDWGDFVYKGHTILLFIFWGIVADIGVFFARQLKSYPKYAKVHGMIFLFQSIITYFFVFSMITFNKEKVQEIQEEDNVTIVHFIIGILILTLITFQLFFGLMVKNNLESLNGSELVYRLKRLHQLCGYLLYAFTKINVALGIEIYAKDLRFWFYAWYILLFLIKVTIEMLYTFEISLFQRERISYHFVESDKTFLHERLIDRLNNGVPRYELLKEFPKLRYVILREAVYDVSDFNHPGGQFIIEAIKGREIGRYFYGGSPIEKLDIIPHKHSYFAINYIETRYIGDLKNECCPILYHDEKQQVTKNELMIWKFTEQSRISSGTKVFYFTSSHFKVRQQIKGVRWFGRYFYIKPFGAGYQLSERPYSIVLCLSEENMQLRQQIIDYFKAKVLEQDDIPIEYPNLQSFRFSDSLNFVIKRQPYSMNMSRFLHETYYKPYEITGPYGLGLELTEQSNGNHYIICNGTGILPFLDFFDFLIKKAFYTILYDRCGAQDAEKINPNDEDYLNIFGSNFKVFLIGAFKNRQEFYGSAIIEDLYTICKSFDLHYFDMLIRMAEANQEGQHSEVYLSGRITEDLLLVKIKDPAKVYVCGSPAFEEDILQQLKTLKIQKKLIVMV